MRCRDQPMDHLTISEINDIRKDHFMSVEERCWLILIWSLFFNISFIHWFGTQSHFIFSASSDNSICNAYYSQNEMFLPSMKILQGSIHRNRNVLVDILPGDFFSHHFFQPHDSKWSEKITNGKLRRHRGNVDELEEEVNWRQQRAEFQAWEMGVWEIFTFFHFNSILQIKFSSQPFIER